MKLTRKQKAFADMLINNPKLSATRAALQTYGKPDKPTTLKTASVIATENLAKPSVMKYLELHAEHAEESVLEIAEYSKDMGKTFSKEGASYASVALAGYKDILDRVHGKATQKVESHSTSVNLNLSLQDILE
jgi:phage terminase small subunit